MRRIAVRGARAVVARHRKTLESKIAGIILAKRPRPVVVTIDGGVSSGKTDFAKRLARELGRNSMKCVVIGVDDYVIPRAARKKLGAGYFDFRNWFRLDVLSKNLGQIRSGKTMVEKPSYSHKTGTDKGFRRLRIPVNAVVIVSGIFTLDERVRKFSDLKILLDAAPEEREKRAIRRDLERSGIPEKETLRRLAEVFEPTYRRHIKENAGFADLVIDNTDFTTPLLKRNLKN